MLLHGGEKGVVADARDVRGKPSGKERDAPMAVGGEVVDDLPCAVLLVRDHARQLEAARAVIDEHDRDALPLKARNEGRLGVACEDDALDLLALPGSLPVGGGRDEQLVGGAVCAPHHAFADARIELVEDGRVLFADEERDLVGLLPRHGPRDRAGLIAERLGGGEDLAACFLADTVGRGEGTGNGRGGNAGETGNIVYRWGIHNSPPLQLYANAYIVFTNSSRKIFGFFISSGLTSA